MEKKDGYKSLLKIFLGRLIKIKMGREKLFVKVRLTQLIKLKMSLLKGYSDSSNLVNFLTCQESRSFVVNDKCCIMPAVFSEEGFLCDA